MTLLTTTPEWTLQHTATVLAFTLVTFIIFAIAIYFARQFDKVLDKPEETFKEDEHANNPGI